MSSDKLNSSSSYTVSSVTSVDINNTILKRPYTNTPFSSGKKQNKSNFFRNTLKSVVSNGNSENNSKNFSDLLNDDSSRLQSEVNSRIIATRFQNNSSVTTAINSDQAADEIVQPKSVENSILCRKIELLNSLRK